MKRNIVATLVIMMFLATPSFATVPVIDYTAVTNQIMQIAKMVDQLKRMQEQIQLLQRQYDAVVGSRGMSLLLNGQNRYYLPKDWQQTMSMLDKPLSGYDQLINRIKQIRDSIGVLNDDDMKRLSSDSRELLKKQRTNAATLKALGETAYRQASDRIALLQVLINKIDTATDQKAILDLQARIQCEQNMLTNDAEKLAAVTELQRAEEQAAEQNARERVIKRLGNKNSKMPQFTASGSN